MWGLKGTYKVRLNKLDRERGLADAWESKERDVSPKAGARGGARGAGREMKSRY